jgi:hypothetical protein
MRELDDAVGLSDLAASAAVWLQQLRIGPQILLSSWCRAQARSSGFTPKSGFGRTVWLHARLPDPTPTHAKIIPHRDKWLAR